MTLTRSEMETIRRQFDSRCRKILREESYSIRKRLARRAEKEVSLSWLSEKELNRFYVIDYKSNYLGNRPECYSAKTISENVFSPYHRYDMQYLIYSVALQRFLRSRLKAKYSYEQHFGGVIYLYLRGLYENQDLGMFATRPSAATVDAFEKLLCED